MGQYRSVEGVSVKHSTKGSEAIPTSAEEEEEEEEEVDDKESVSEWGAEEVGGGSRRFGCGRHSSLSFLVVRFVGDVDVRGEDVEENEDAR